MIGNEQEHNPAAIIMPQFYFAVELFMYVAALFALPFLGEIIPHIPHCRAGRTSLLLRPH
jgi:hypothetical protein